MKCTCAILSSVASLYYIFPHRRSGTILTKKKKVTKHKMCFDFLCTFGLKHFSFHKELSKIWSKMFIGIHVKCPLLLSDFNETWIFLTDFQTVLKYWSWVVPCMQTDRHDKANNCFLLIIKPTRCTNFSNLFLE